MSNEIVKPPTAPSNSLTPKLKRIHNSKIAVEFHGSYLKQDKVTFSLKSEINLFIVYRLDVWSRDLNTKFTLGGCLFEAVKLTKNADLDKYGYRGYDIGFDAPSEFLFPSGGCGKNVVIFCVESSLSVHADNKERTS